MLLKRSISHAIKASVTISAVAVIAAQSAAPASAGTYTVPLCNQSATGSTASWTHSWTVGASLYFFTDNNCRANSGYLYRRFEIGTMPAGASDDWTFDAPAGTYISELQMWQDTTPRSPGAMNAIYAWEEDGTRNLVAASRPGTVLGNSRYGFPLSGFKVVKLRTSLLCQDGANCPGIDPSTGLYGNEDYWHGANVILVDPSLPTFNSLTGEGWKAEPADGQDSIDYAVADVGSGVKELRFYVDGVLQSTAPAGCTAELRVPCPGSASGSFSLDTTRLSEGQHDLRLALDDGSLNEHAKQLTVTVRRPPTATASSSGGTPVTVTDPSWSGSGAPAVGDQLRGSQGTWSGSGLSFSYQWMRCASDGTNCAPIPGATGVNYTATADDIGHGLQFCVTASNSGGSTTSCSAPTAPIASAHPSLASSPETVGGGGTPVKGTTGTTTGADRGTPNGSPASERAVLIALVNNRSSSRKVKFGKRVSIGGRLVGPTGAPIANAIVSVQTQTAIPGASMADAAKIVTAGDGRFTYVAPAGPSRTIRFGYRAYTADTSFADTTDVRLLVSAGVTMGATPRAVHNRHATVFKGRLLGRPLAKRGVVVDLQVFFRKQWRTFAAPRTSRSGAYRFKYRFMAGAATWKFRARVRRDSAYPFEIGYSPKPIKVTVLD